VIEDPKRHKELEGMVTRMGAVAAVFRVRSDVIGCHRFLAFEALMDVFIKLCRQTLAGNEDFCTEPLRIEAKDQQDVINAFKAIFGYEPADFFSSEESTE
jgi:hypothetical protein